MVDEIYVPLESIHFLSYYPWRIKEDLAGNVFCVI